MPSSSTTTTKEAIEPAVQPSCPFCAIALATPPSRALLLPPTSFPPPRATTPPLDPARRVVVAHVILSTPHLVAFLDHAPISRGHVLLVVREHVEKLGDVRVAEGEAVGRWLGVVSRAVMGAVKEEEEEREGGGESGRGGEEGDDVDVGDWNVVQNNGARAAQVVPHVHFHIIPRVDDVPEVKARSWTVFGKGQREELDEDDAVVLVKRMRERLRNEVERVRRREGEEGVGRLMGNGRERSEEGGGDGDGLWMGTGGRSKL